MVRIAGAGAVKRTALLFSINVVIKMANGDLVFHIYKHLWKAIKPSAQIHCTLSTEWTFFFLSTFIESNWPPFAAGLSKQTEQMFALR